MRITGGAARGIRIGCAKNFASRPSTDAMRAAVFSSLAAMGKSMEGARFADIFAGSGAYGLEAISRGARSGVFIELSASNCSQIRANIEAVTAAIAVGRWNFKVCCGNAFSIGIGPFDILFADPPYKMLLEETARCMALIGKRLAAAGCGAVALLEAPSELEIPEQQALTLIYTVGRKRGRGSPMVLVFEKNSGSAIYSE